MLLLCDFVLISSAPNPCSFVLTVHTFLLISFRRWVVVDKDRNYIKSYNKPVFAQVTPHFEDNKKTLCLNAPGMDTLRVNVHLDNEENYVEDLKYDLLFLFRCFSVTVRSRKHPPVLQLFSSFSLPSSTTRVTTTTSSHTTIISNDIFTVNISITTMYLFTKTS